MFSETGSVFKRLVFGFMTNYINDKLWRPPSLLKRNID
ncbi:Uncharacterised protein [Cedecea neteri]|uniref:Uncharacterized protein n=1 Tax=Cedecea neteri TaxID=158822 RepID=A0A2X3J7V3_9ENTR|nr:Uncharacterised protein [Cedecea neteri]